MVIRQSFNPIAAPPAPAAFILFHGEYVMNTRGFFMTGATINYLI
jgi:hypothetical protein